jgi:hypothetical protein
MHVQEGFHHSFFDFIEEETKFYPVGNDIGGIQSQAKLPSIPFSAMMDGVNLEETRFSLIPGVMGTDGDMLFKNFPSLVPLKLRGEFFPVAFQGLVDGGGAYR